MRVYARAYTHTNTTACEISLDGGAGEGGAWPSNNRAAGQEQTEGNTEAHTRPHGLQVRVCGQPGGPSAPGQGPTGAITVTQSCAHGVRGGNFKMKPPVPFSQMGNGRERAGSGQDTGEMRVAAGRGPQWPTAVRAPQGPVFVKYTMFVSTCLATRRHNPGHGT